MAVRQSASARPSSSSSSSPQTPTGPCPPGSDHPNAATATAAAAAVATTHRPARTVSTPTINGFCGALAGLASGVVTCPLDVIKTKLQNQRSFRDAAAAQAGAGQRSAALSPYRGLWGTARIIVAEDGLRGFYRGLGPLVLGYLPTWTVYMAVYDGSREKYNTVFESKWKSRVAASLTAGACSTLVTNPIWVIKTRLMSQSSLRSSTGYYLSTTDAIQKIFQTEGIRAFYSGLVPALFGLTHVAIQFPLYEYFKFQLTGLEMGQNPPDGDSHHYFGIMMATFLSKLCASSATYPHEVLRTRMQTARPLQAGAAGAAGAAAPGAPSSSATGAATGAAAAPQRGQYVGLVETIRTMVRQEGWRAFYAGMGTNLVRAVPAAITTMLTYEFVKASLQPKV